MCIRVTSQSSYPPSPLRIFSARVAVTTSIKRGQEQHAIQLSSPASSVHEADRAPSFLPYCGEFRPILVDGPHRVSSSLSRISINPRRRYTTGSLSRASTGSHRQSTLQFPASSITAFSRTTFSVPTTNPNTPNTHCGLRHYIGDLQHRGFTQPSYAMVIGGLRHPCFFYSSVSFSVSPSSIAPIH